MFAQSLALQDHNIDERANTSLEARASELFERAYHAKPVYRLQRWFERPIQPLATLDDVADAHDLTQRHYAGTMAVPLCAIQGTLDRGEDFDANFRPIERHTEWRWVRVATAMLRGIDLPPVELVQVGDSYFVQDGHHRVSVSRTMGFRYIDAVVTKWEK
jgi:hypothetical protein